MKKMFKKMVGPLALTGALMASPAIAADAEGGLYTVKACTPGGMTASAQVMAGDTHGSRSSVQAVLDKNFAKAAIEFKNNPGSLDSKFEKTFGKVAVPVDKAAAFRPEIERTMGSAAYQELAKRAQSTADAFGNAEQQLGAVVFGARLSPLKPGCPSR